MDQKLVTTIAFGALVLWLMYRRVRRHFGRQRVNATQLGVRVAVLLAVGVLLLSSLGVHADMLAAFAGGAMGGLLLGYVGLRHTLFETTPEGRFYTPHTYIGLLVTAVFVVRFGFRLFSIYGGSQMAAGVSPDPMAGLRGSPLTVATLGLLIGYYVFFNLGVLRKSRAAGVTAISAGSSTKGSGTPTPPPVA